MSKPKADILQGTLEMLVLKSLTDGRKHGYGIARWLEETSSDLLQIEQGSLYPALYRMEERGLISARWGVTELNRRAKFYTLTARGRERLQEEVASWERLVKAVGLILTPQDV
jgi:transcriptional regulator